MSELVPIFVVWIVFYYTYKLIGLYARRKERLLMIEKMNAVGDVGIDDKELFAHSFTALRVGCLLIGVGIGLLIGVIIQTMLVSAGYDMNQWADRKLFEISSRTQVFPSPKGLKKCFRYGCLTLCDSSVTHLLKRSLIYPKLWMFAKTF